MLRRQSHQTIVDRDVEVGTPRRGGTGRPGGKRLAFAVSSCHDADVDRSDIARAAAISVAAALGLPTGDAIVLHNSDKLTLRLTPCDVLARVALVGKEVAQLEVDLVQRLADTGCPVGALEPRVVPRVYRVDGFAVTLWRYYEPTAGGASPVEYARALERLHAGMRMVGGTALASPLELRKPKKSSRTRIVRRLSPK